MIKITRPNHWLAASAITIIASLILIVAIGPTWGIDFAGGSLLEVSSEQRTAQTITSFLQSEFRLPATVQVTSEETVIIRTEFITEETHQDILAALREAELVGDDERRFETIGPVVGQELRRKSLVAVGFVVAVLIAYLAYTFRTVRGFGQPWQFGVAAAYAMIHDLLVVTAVFVIFGKLWQAPVDTLFVTAQLAILGYSVNDTIVIFQRAKEEWLIGGKSRLAVINTALQKSLGRSLNTSLTTLAVLACLLIFGGASIRWFVAALAAGTIIGTYSSLFIAPPLLLFLAKRHDR